MEEADGAKLVQSISEKMAEMFRSKAQAARRLVEAAEEAHLQHEENPELQVRDPRHVQVFHNSLGIFL
ncbi:voltage-dependent calcium channel subunit alpha-2/delta-3 isoform X1 [Tachysurus ichikawai]